VVGGAEKIMPAGKLRGVLGGRIFAATQRLVNSLRCALWRIRLRDTTPHITMPPIRTDRAKTQ